jgi:hypothetical protein
MLRSSRKQLHESLPCVKFFLNMNAIDEQTYLADIEESFPRPMRRLEDEEPELPPYELLRQENEALHEEVRYLRALLESNKGGR